jgi:formate-dependent nitrite reductase cytochrome c552 subunit
MQKRLDANRKVVYKLKANPCKDCEGSFKPWQMQFDHRDPSQKKARVSSLMTSGSVDAILEEIEKCDLVCANCHADRTYQRLQEQKL